MKSNIYLWDSTKIDDKVYSNINAKKYKNIRKIAKESNVRIKIFKKYGVPFIINRYRKRIGLLIGVLIFISFLFIMSQFIWSIEIHGAKTIDQKKLLEFIHQHNLTCGTYKRIVDVRSIEREALLHFDDISWISINIQGSKANIEINERIKPPEKIDAGDPCNIVASKRGTIKYFEVYTGQKVIEVGDSVDEGQILVSGIIEDKSLNNTWIRSRAKVIAEIEENVEYWQPLIEETINYIDFSKVYYLELFGNKIPVNFSKKPDEHIVKFESTIYPKFFNINMPFIIHKQENKIENKTYLKISQKIARSKLLKLIKKSEEKMINEDIIIISNNIINEDIIDNKYKITKKYITHQNISKEQKIQISN